MMELDCSIWALLLIIVFNGVGGRKERVRQYGDYCTAPVVCSLSHSTAHETLGALDWFPLRLSHLLNNLALLQLLSGSLFSLFDIKVPSVHQGNVVDHRVESDPANENSHIESYFGMDIEQNGSNGLHSIENRQSVAKLVDSR